uniref:Uncharacterized protein n=1 Tax=Timema monikensis TaxID=170555 RepID=A0A7R9DZQ4_9NEOP|nr:unnamed protein product [Timema monikensis]
MRSSTVSAPVLAISTPLPSSCNKYVAVELLTKEILYFIVETKSRSKELYSQTCLHLGSQGMVDYDLFGLAILSGIKRAEVPPTVEKEECPPPSLHNHHLTPPIGRAYIPEAAQ